MLCSETGVGQTLYDTLILLLYFVISYSILSSQHSPGIYYPKMPISEKETNLGIHRIMSLLVLIIDILKVK